MTDTSPLRPQPPRPRSLRRSLLLALATVALVLPGAAFADPPGGPGLGGPGSFMGRHHGPGMRFGPGGPEGPGGRGFLFEHMAEKLDLTDDQRQTVRGILEDHEATIQPLLDQMIALRKAQFEKIHATSFDESAIRAAAQQLAAAEVELAVARGRIASEVRAVLTDEQKSELDAMHRRMAEFAEGVAGMRGHRRGFVD